MKRVVCLLILLCLLLSAVSASAKKKYDPVPLEALDASVFEWIPEGEDVPFLHEKNGLYVIAVPVGAQDCYLVMCDGESMLLDCAAQGRDPTPDFLPRLLEAFGIERLNIAFNTHPHADHVNGYPDVLARFPADAYYTAFPLRHNHQQVRVLSRVRALGIPIVEYVPGDPIQLGGAEITTWQIRKVKSDNDRSIIMHIRYGSRSILFTGDIFSTTEKVLAQQAGSAIRSDILKLPHHGIGLLSREFLDTVDPGIAFVSNSVKSKDTLNQMQEMAKRRIPVVPTARAPFVMATDG